MKQNKCAAFAAAVLGMVFLLSSCANSEEGSDASMTDSSEATVSQADEKPVKGVIEYDPDKPVIALTFDDGPNTVITPLVLDKLEKYGAAASFFLVGSNIDDDSAEVVRRAYEMGCDIENHSLTHSSMTEMTSEEIEAEITQTNNLIYDIVGEYPTFFRPPYIAVNDTMFNTIDMPFICGYGCEDYNSEVTVDQRVEKVLSQAKDGAIILLHDMQNNVQTVQALDEIIPSLQEEGYQLVTISQLFEAKGITPDSEKQIIYSFAEQTEMYG